MWDGGEGVRSRCPRSRLRWLGGLALSKRSSFYVGRDVGDESIFSGRRGGRRASAGARSRGGSPRRGGGRTRCGSRRGTRRGRRREPIPSDRAARASATTVEAFFSASMSSETPAGSWLNLWLSYAATGRRGRRASLWSRSDLGKYRAGRSRNLTVTRGGGFATVAQV